MRVWDWVLRGILGLRVWDWVLRGILGAESVGLVGV